MAIEAVLLDFYGTLAHATRWLSVNDVLAEHGAQLSDDAVFHLWQGGIDGIEHHEHSRSREHYRAWQRQRLGAMLTEADVHPAEHDEIVRKLAAGTAERVLEAYPESAEVVEELRARGLRLAVCSNWDWDLTEALEEVHLGDAFDVVVSSAWAGARKPHARIFEDTLAKVGVNASSAIFVGDTWNADVVGPRSLGMTPLYLRRPGDPTDVTAPDDPGDVAVAVDLRAVLTMLPRS